MGHSDAHAPDSGAPSQIGASEKLLFWACFISLIATAFGFTIRTQIIEEWGKQFNLSPTQQGEIFGVGLWPFAISIVFFSLVIDRIGYGKAMVFAFACHMISAAMTYFATGYNSLYWATFIVALANGTVEAVINPVVATVFSKEKTKWLNILHAGWPGGIVLAGLLSMLMGNADWHYKVGLMFVPVVAYGVLMLRCKFPVNERVTAGVSYMSMLQEVGFLGALIIVGLISFELARVFEFPDMVKYLVWGVLSIGYGLYVKSLGRPLFVFLLLVMIPLATTELGTDSWITPLMEPEMAQLGLKGGWVLLYTSLIMMILRFFAGPIVHKLSPLGLLAMSAAIAACGLFFLSKATGITILAAATLYGFGKTFFWPTMLGVVAEQFPKGGALTLNTIAGVGMLSVGTVGAAFLGNIQDSSIDKNLEAKNPALHQKVVGEQHTSIFGTYKPVDASKVDSLPANEKDEVVEIQREAKKSALQTVAIFPCIMFVCYIGLILYFKSQGGYKAKILISQSDEDRLMMGGSEGPSEM